MGSWLGLKLGCGTAQESCVVDFLVSFLVFFSYFVVTNWHEKIFTRADPPL